MSSSSSVPPQQQPPPLPAETAAAAAKLEELLDSLLKISITVANYQPESAQVLQRRINEYVTHLADLDVLREALDVRVPLSILEALDAGKDPDVTTGELVQLAVDANQKTHGRMRALQMLNRDVASEVQRNYPELWATHATSGAAQFPIPAGPGLDQSHLLLAPPAPPPPSGAASAAAAAALPPPPH
ncbi:Mediator of RNA polymerase II transcription subunit 10, partial [Cladochytrium tenue]